MKLSIMEEIASLLVKTKIMNIIKRRMLIAASFFLFLFGIMSLQVRDATIEYVEREVSI